LPELIAGSKTPDVGVKNAMMKALQEVVGKAGGNMSEASRQAILALIDDDSSDQTGKIIIFDFRTLRFTNASIDSVAITNARLLAALVKVLPATSSVPLIKYALPFLEAKCVKS
jgi:hypothetical protein